MSLRPVSTLFQSLARYTTPRLRFIVHPSAFIAAKRTIPIRQFHSSVSNLVKMKAILIKDGKGPADNLYLGEEETPEPQQGQVQVKVNFPQRPLGTS
jgi:hypothetical protein